MTHVRLALVLLVILAIPTPSTALAQGSATPSYDIAGYCEQISQAIGGSYQIKAYCIKDERASLAVAAEATGLLS